MCAVLCTDVYQVLEIRLLILVLPPELGSLYFSKTKKKKQKKKTLIDDYFNQYPNLS